MQKQTFILTTMLFLMFSPVPDSLDITEMSTNFLVPTGHSVLLASDKLVQMNVEDHSKKQQMKRKTKPLLRSGEP